MVWLKVLGLPLNQCLMKFSSDEFLESMYEYIVTCVQHVQERHEEYKERYDHH